VIGAIGAIETTGTTGMIGAMGVTLEIVDAQAGGLQAKKPLPAQKLWYFDHSPLCLKPFGALRHHGFPQASCFGRPAHSQVGLHPEMGVGLEAVGQIHLSLKAWVVVTGYCR
jgi:hypothetical protein